MKNRFRTYLFIQLTVVCLVVLSFRIIPEKKWASVFASSFFFVASAAVGLLEFKRPRAERSWLLLSATGFFMFVFILPIILMRIFSWQTDFNSYQLLGVSGAQMHHAANLAYMLMLVAYFAESFRKNRELAGIKKQS